ncbi:MAG: hypothetical protein HQ567_12075 [Candidatus Nealsonbacteria bacterium]|nr:hypothetical protein [Candidatus Nealsonbacteria bacterium]
MPICDCGTTFDRCCSRNNRKRSSSPVDGGRPSEKRQLTDGPTGLILVWGAAI